MTHRNTRLLKILGTALLVGVALLVVASPALGLNSFLKTWEDVYPESSSADAGCALCHGSSTKNLNAYGRDLCLEFNGSVPADFAGSLHNIENLDSDGDGNSNLVEIQANAQPGWTMGDNQLYATLDGDCAPIGNPISVPSNVPLPYDPPAGGDPVAVPGGPYSGYINVPITFDGSASYDSDSGEIVSYEWDFGDGSTGSGTMPQHTYTVDGIYTVSLTVSDDEGASNTNSTTASISSSAVLDLDIDTLKVTKSQRVGKAISIELSVENPGTVLGQALATVVGEQDGVVIYNWRLNVYDYNGKGTTKFDFPDYIPTTKGTITWTATIADVDPDIDLVTATTVVK
ncbi:MAG: PKD domain-containing protein [Anaerolineae bacterium]